MRGRTKNAALWLSGPDEVAHSYYSVFVQQRNQSQYRKEEWELSFAEWYATWGEDIARRGRTRGSLTMSRVDPTLPWAIGNVILVGKVGPYTPKQ